MSTFTFFQGDILFLHMSNESIRTGEIVVFNVDVCGPDIIYIFGNIVFLIY